MAVADDLIAVRTLLILRGRAVGDWEDNHGRLCVGHAISYVARHDGAAQHQMADALIEHLDPKMVARATRAIKREVPGATEDTYWLGIIAVYNDQIAEDDQDVFDLIDKALAELGAL